ncbi:hypothetical protein ACWD00_41730 [Streptomyces viridiviolaceus]
MKGGGDRLAVAVLAQYPMATTEQMHQQWWSAHDVPSDVGRFTAAAGRCADRRTSSRRDASLRDPELVGIAITLDRHPDPADPDPVC